MQPTKAVVAAVLVLNIAVGIAVICVVATAATLWNTAEELKKQIDEIYDDHQQTLHHPRGEQQTTSLEYRNTLKPIAFLTGLNFGENDEDTPTNTAVRNWIDFVGSVQYLHKNMEYENGSVSIPTAGVYVVYSHVKFYTEKNHRVDPELDFHHSITRYNAVSQQTETVSGNIVCENKNNVIDGASLEYSSDIHSLVQLNAGDQVIVNVSHLELLKPDKDWHYFGVYMI
ncbi:uncharacterized protein LOC124122750 [Haliotis rufescens]|uniref:uncharacterized protein LOC124122750 n=1 Tax=Haliotis rufescens TaxID=6454 RepID=UPI00201F2BF2|nr:uncharacterized protein LOC124122750 [Haliotis rufescens]XP_048247381.1 uncharacterized protein LOC124122750 [Haliotis rufescens]